MPALDQLWNALPVRWKLERRSDYSRLRGHLFRIAAVLVALGLAAVVIEASGKSAIEMAASVGRSTLGSSFGRVQVLVLATPLILIGAALLIGLRMRLFNLGLEGQYCMGAFLAAGIGLHLEGPPGLMVPLILLASAIGGALFAVVPALMRTRAGVSEILTTLLMNPIAVQWITYIGMAVWRDSTSLAGATSNATPRLAYELPTVWDGVHIGIFIAVLAVFAIWLVFSRTVWGYEVTSIGANRGAAQFAGMPVLRTTVVVMLLSGAIAGLSGAIQLLAIDHRLSGRFSQGYGWLGINVAILSGGEPLALLPWGLFLALVLNGGTVLKVQGLSVDLVIALTGLILLLAAIGEVAANYRLVHSSAVARVGKPEVDLLETGHC